LLFFSICKIKAEDVKVSEKEFQIRTQAQELSEKGKTAEAIVLIDEYEKSLKLPMHYILYEYRGSLWALSEKYPNAIKDYLKAYRIHKTKESISSLGLCYMYMKDYFNAESLFREGMLLSDNPINFKKGLLQCFLYQERYREGVSLVESLLIENPLDKELLSLAAQIYRQLGDNDKAWENLKLLQLQGATPKKDLELLFDIALQKKLITLSENIANEIINRKEEMSMVRLTNLVISFLQLNQTEKAEKWIAIANKQGKTEKLTLYLAESLRIKDPARSLSLIQSIKDLAEMDGRYYLVLGELILRNGERKKALALFKEAATFEEYRKPALWQIFSVYRTDKNNKECYATLMELQQLEPDNESIVSFLDFYRGKD
jgi:tetratricopeptide (TPR) repeat protein